MFRLEHPPFLLETGLVLFPTGDEVTPRDTLLSALECWFVSTSGGDSDEGPASRNVEVYWLALNCFGDLIASDLAENIESTAGPGEVFWNRSELPVVLVQIRFGCRRNPGSPDSIRISS